MIDREKHSWNSIYQLVYYLDFELFLQWLSSCPLRWPAVPFLKFFLRKLVVARGQCGIDPLLHDNSWELSLCFPKQYTFNSKNLDAIIHAFKKCQCISFYDSTTLGQAIPALVLDAAVCNQSIYTTSTALFLESFSTYHLSVRVSILTIVLWQRFSTFFISWHAKIYIFCQSDKK